MRIISKAYIGRFICRHKQGRAPNDFPHPSYMGAMCVPFLSIN
jgi:hypothetical protein